MQYSNVGMQPRTTSRQKRSSYMYMSEKSYSRMKSYNAAICKLPKHARILKKIWVKLLINRAKMHCKATCGQTCTEAIPQATKRKISKKKFTRGSAKGELLHDVI